MLRGIEPVARLVDEAARLGWHSVVIAEHADLGTVVAAWRQAQARRINAIAAAEVAAVVAPSRQPLRSPPENALVIARNDRGLETLMSIVSRHRLAEAATTEVEGNHRFDLAGELTRDPSGIWILTSSRPLAEELVERLGGSARRRVFIEIDRFSSTRSQQFHRQELARDLGLPLVHSSRHGVIGKPAAAAFHLLEAIRTTSTIATVALDPRDRPLSSLPTPTMVRDLYRDLPEAVENAGRIGDEARLSFDKRPTIFPYFPVPAGETPFGLLHQQCHAGLQRRYRNLPPAVVSRLARELEVIDRMGFVPYFLVVGEIVATARRLGIECAGRGSGAASIVSYLLGITQVDPIAHRLRFERFLHPGRTDLPDIDIDLCWIGRDRVVEHVYRRYGQERVAMICTICSLKVRSAFRESARAHGLSPADVDAVSRRLPHRSEEPIARLLTGDAALDAVSLSPEVRRQLLADADWLRGRPHHRSVHPGGICIADRPIDRVVSLERARKGIVVTQLDMYSIEETGLIKIDLLGNRCISEMGAVRDRIEASSGHRIDLDAIPERDTATARLVSRGNTLGCFQLESPSMRSLLVQLRARDAHQVIQAVALVRPGPASGGIKDAFCRRVRGLEAPKAPHPALEGLLADQQGLMLYEENVMEAAAAITGLSLGGGDLLRRALQKCVRHGDKAHERQLADRFIADAIAHGTAAGDSREIWQLLVRFSRYAFNKAHAASYGLLAWRSAWLKAHHPREFLCALFDHHAGMYPFAAFAAEARRLQVPLLLPCIERSERTFSLEDGGIRIPLAMVRGSRHTSIDALIAGRPFGSLEDLIRRVPLPLGELEEWILIGALDILDRSRYGLLWRARLAHRRERGRAAEPDLDGVVDPSPISGTFSVERRLAEELRLLGAGITLHPMECHRLRAHQEGCVFLEQVNRASGRHIRIAGIRIASCHHRTASGQMMGFITLEDETGVAEVTFFPRSWRKARRVLLDHDGPLLVEGRVEERLGAFTIDGGRVRPLLGG